MPLEMTFHGRNFDIATAVTAPMLAGWIALRGSVPRRVIVGWNVMGITILGNTVVTGVLSAPGRQRMLETAVPNMAVLLFPYVYIPALMVPLAFTLHILSIRNARGFRS